MLDALVAKRKKNKKTPDAKTEDEEKTTLHRKTLAYHLSDLYMMGQGGLDGVNMEFLIGTRIH